MTTIDFAAARKRIRPTAYIVPEADMFIDIELAAPLPRAKTLAELLTECVDEIGVKGAWQELER